MVRRGLALALLGVLDAAVGALLVSRYWDIDVSLLSFAALMVVYISLRSVELPEWLIPRTTEIRSRVYLYSKLASAGRPRESESAAFGRRLTAFVASRFRDSPKDEMEKLVSRLRAQTQAP